MQLRRFRLSTRAMLAIVAVIAVFLASAERLFVGDGGVDFQFVNVMDKPIHDLRLSCNGREIAVAILPPGASVRGRLWPADYAPGGNMNASFGLTYTVNGAVKKWNPSFTFNLLKQEPSFRLEMGEQKGEEAWSVTFPHVEVSSTRLALRRLWFSIFPLRR